MLGGLRKILQGAKDQVNPFDGGKSWGNPQGKPAPKPMARPAMPYGMKDMSTADTGIVGPTSNYPPIGPPSRAFEPETEDNRITNDMVNRGLLPQSRREIYPNPGGGAYGARPIVYEDGSTSDGRRAGDSMDDFMPALLRTLFRR